MRSAFEAQWGRVRRLVLLVLLVPVVAACGGSGGADSGNGPAAVEALDSTPIEGALPNWMDPHLAEPGPEVGLIFATSDYADGLNRIAFLLVDEEGELIQVPEADVFFAQEESLEPAAAVAELHPLEPHSHPPGTEPHDHIDFDDVYVVQATLPSPGRYWLAVQPRGEEIQGLGAIDVKNESLTPEVGTAAIASDNPTLDDAPAELISTADPPHIDLLRYSIADSLDEGVPFVVAFATPQFCQTRACGPTVDTVDKLRQEFQDSSIRFIHVEIYEDNEPQKGVNKWVREWSLPTEPWVFVVDGQGTIRAKFEGVVSLQELEDAVQVQLLSDESLQ